MDPREIRDKISVGWLQVHLVFEVLGKPAKHVEETLKIILEKFEKEKNLELVEKKIYEAKPVGEKKNVFTTFAEVEILIEKLPRLMDIVFDYMPSSIEIVKPINFVFKLEDANVLLNDLAARLHQYDALTKTLKIEREILAKRLSEELKKEKEREENKEKEEKD